MALQTTRTRTLGRGPVRRLAIVPKADFVLASHYDGAAGRALIAEILRAAEAENLYAGIMGTDEVPLIKAEGITGYEGPPISVFATIDELRKGWRRWTGAIDAYDLAVGVTARGKAIGVLYRNPAHPSGIRGLQHHVIGAESNDGMAEAVSKLAEAIERLEARIDDRLDADVAPLRRHLATIVRSLEGLHPRIAIR